MKIIGIETSGWVGSVALCEDDVVLGERSLEKGMRHGKLLVPSLEEIFREVGLSTEEVDLIAVSHGPGSYTGLRVGITCAKTLAYALKRPLVPVPTLDVLAENFTPDKMSICPVIDARRKAVYACIYKPLDSLWHRVSDLLVISPQALLDILPKPILIFGDGAVAYKDVFAVEGINFGDEEMGVAKARIVACLGWRAFKRGKVCDPFQLQPLYLRRPEAEERWEAPRRY